MPKDTNIIIHLKIDQRAPLATLRKALHVQSRSYWAPANIGPYSQATSMPIESNHEPLALAMSIAGQIPLIPSSMDLPSGNEAFELQTVLALQHLWRIGEEVEVRWWTSAVAYLPRGTAEEVSRRAAIAGRAWREIHTRALDDADPADEPGRDLWEEKHYAGKEQLGADEPRRVLPDWTAVRADVDAAETDFPPFFAVEIEALPRSSLVEWHAHLGVVNASVRVGYPPPLDFSDELSTNYLQLRSRGKDGCWTAYQCSFGNAIQSAIMISTADKLEEIEVRAREAADALGIPAGRASYLAYFDVTMEGLEHNFELELFRGFVPCRSVLDINGKKLAAVLLFDTEPQT
jgi:diphthine-ammonia ligase